MWELAELLREHDFSVEQLKARCIGRTVWGDRYQIAAVPHRRPRR
jgi:hypothetical protein